MRLYLIVLLIVEYFSFSQDPYSTLDSENYLSAERTITDSTLTKSIKRGAIIYADFCVQCHMENGDGVRNTYPPLAKADFLLTNKQESIKAIKYGLKGKITVNGAIYNSIMPPLGLYDDEVADVMNYISNSWGNTSKLVTEKDVQLINN